MFYVKVFVPRITKKQINIWEEQIPGLSTVASIPVIHNQKEAIKIGARLAVAQLKGKEFLTKQNAKVVETEKGWDIDFIAYGNKESDE